MPIYRTTQYDVLVPHKPGQLARVTSLLAESGVNLAGIATEERGGEACISFVAEPDHGFERRLRDEGLVVTSAPALRVQLDARPELLDALAAALARHGLRARSWYGRSDGTRADWVMCVDDPDRALEALAAVCGEGEPARELAASR